ncbi:NUDIX hydrolase [Agrobacterium sp. DKPNP3]|uniref:NUDIX hydrolase n=1 Tax=Agrobacterium sp. DKPNP3 TaxID=3457323 RepID=UPI004044CC6F
MSLFLPMTPTEPQLYQRPIAATIAVVVREGYTLLVRRANMPDAGKWGFPGGKIEAGETINDAAVRELLEETRVIANPLRVLTAVDAFEHDEQGMLRSHHILIAVLCEWHSGTPVAGDDALEARWFSLEELQDADLALSMDVVSVARLGAAFASWESEE